MVAWVRTRSNGRRTHWGRHILLVNFPPRASSTRHAHWIIEDTVKRGVNIGLLLLAGTKEGGFPSFLVLMFSSLSRKQITARRPVLEWGCCAGVALLQ